MSHWICAIAIGLVVCALGVLAIVWVITGVVNDVLRELHRQGKYKP